MPTVQLPDRAVILAAGPDAESLLQNVITTDLASLAQGAARPGALLTPQGKIFFDFVISRKGEDAFRLDCRKDTAQDLIKRLTLYKIRAKMEISLQEQEVVAVSWGGDSSTSQLDSTVRDRRFPEEQAILRHYGQAAPGDADPQAWHRLRIAHGVAESGADYSLGEAFPHDVLFDQNDGVGLKKGCFVGQEVVSRMHHRGTARRRLVVVEGERPLPATGTAIEAGGRPLGALGTVSGSHALAIVRIDRVAEANAAGKPLLADDVPLELSVPAYADFSLTDTDGKAETG